VSDVDSAAIMAEHAEDHAGYCDSCRWATWPCLPYRLAEALTETREAWALCREERDRHANRAVAAERALAEAQGDGT
jgi:hypothetical protein